LSNVGKIEQAINNNAMATDYNEHNSNYRIREKAGVFTIEEKFFTSEQSFLGWLLRKPVQRCAYWRLVNEMGSVVTNGNAPVINFRYKNMQEAEAVVYKLLNPCKFYYYGYSPTVITFGDCEEKYLNDIQQ
jgi:hypothetical protein